MWKRTEYRYTTMMSMAMLLKTGGWRIKKEDDLPATKEGSLRVFQEAFILTILKEASGAYGFSPNGCFTHIEEYEDENGGAAEVRCGKNALRCLLEGLWGSIEGERLCLDIEGMGLDHAYFKYLPESRENYVSVIDILEGKAPSSANVRRFVAMLCSHPFCYEAHLADERGIGLLDYPAKLRKETVRAALERE